MERHQHRQRDYPPLSAEWIEREATALLHGLKYGLIVWHYRVEPPESLDAVVARLRELAQAERVRLVVKRELESGKVRYRRGRDARRSNGDIHRGT
jgi:hypothetical protein